MVIHVVHLHVLAAVMCSSNWCSRGILAIFFETKGPSEIGEICVTVTEIGDKSENLLKVDAEYFGHCAG